MVHSFSDQGERWCEVMTMRFEPVVNIGNFISVLLMLGGLAGMYVDIRVILTRHDDRISVVESQVAAFTALAAAVTSAQAKISNIESSMAESKANSEKAVDKLTQIQIDIAEIRALYQGSRNGSSGPPAR